jgi:hypothetical protein
MVAEGVPGQLRDQPVVLVGVVAPGDDHQVGRDLTLQVLEHLLDLRPRPGEEAVPERLEDHAGPLHVLEERGRAGGRLPLAHPVGGQHHPGDVQRDPGGGQLQDGPAAADLDVVGMGADDKDLQGPPVGRAELQWDHRPGPRLIAASAGAA